MQEVIQSKPLIRAAQVSFFASIFIFALKVWAAVITNSAALMSDAMESIVNVLAASVALGVVYFSTKPADHDHPYGHGKAEYVSAAFEGGLVTFAAIVIFMQSISRLIKPIEIQQLDLGVVISMGAALLNLFLGYYLRVAAENYKSDAIRASSVHVLSDVKTSFGVLLGLALVRFTGWTILDPILALIIGLSLAWDGWKILSEAFRGLLDAKDDESLGSLAVALQKFRTQGLIDIHDLRSIRSGAFHHIDAHVVVPQYWDVAKAHETMEEFEKQVIANYPFDAEIAFHIDPCRQKFCTSCDIHDCPIRAESFKKLTEFDLQKVTSHYMA